MRFYRDIIQGIVIGLALAVLVPAATFAARTGTFLLSDLTFSSAQLQVNLPAPILSINPATTTGSVSNGTIAFAVTALDGVGETIPSAALATSSTLNSAGYIITWPAVTGAIGYRVYFSTSTSPSQQSFTQYFTATTTGRYTFQSTTSPTFIPAGIPVVNTAYVVNFASSTNSWINGGKLGIGTTTPQFLLSVVTEPAGNGTISTTTTLFGNQGTSTSRTCFNVVTSAGTAASFYVNGAGTVVVALAKCT